MQRNAKSPAWPTVFRPGARLFFFFVGGFMDFDWAAASSQFTAVCVAAYGLYKAVVKFVSVLRKKR